MQTNTQEYLIEKEVKIEKNDLETNQFFSIPEEIQKNISEKGFHLYKWIDSNEVKSSIQRDFLKYINYLGIPFAFILIAPSIILFYSASPTFSGYFFLWMLGIMNLLLFGFLLFLGIKRSRIFAKNSYVVMTNNSFSINGKIEKFQNGQIPKNAELRDIWEIFEEELFEKSNIEATKKTHIKKTWGKFTSWISWILQIWKRSDPKKWSGKILLILMWLYLAYSLSLWFIYIIGIVLIWIFGILLNIIHKQILLFQKHDITLINNDFENINIYSQKLQREKENLSTNLLWAQKNEWTKQLQNNIHSGITSINAAAQSAIKTSQDLKKHIEQSKYREMFEFHIYNWWIKKQILTPLVEIKILLESSLASISHKEQEIIQQINNTSDMSYISVLTATRKRSEMRRKEIQKNIEHISIYINKLQ